MSEPESEKRLAQRFVDLGPEKPVEEIENFQRALAAGPDRSVAVPTYAERQKSASCIKGYAGEVPEKYRVAPTAESLMLDAPPTEAEKRAIGLYLSGASPAEIEEVWDPHAQEAVAAIKKERRGEDNDHALRSVVDQQAALRWLRDINPPQEVPRPDSSLFEDEFALQLRARTGRGFMECKEALRATSGNPEKAEDLLMRQKALQDTLSEPASEEEQALMRRLRDLTNASKRECLLALRKSGGDFEKAKEFLGHVAR